MAQEHGSQSTQMTSPSMKAVGQWEKVTSQDMTGNICPVHEWEQQAGGRSQAQEAAIGLPLYLTAGLPRGW